MGPLVIVVCCCIAVVLALLPTRAVISRLTAKDEAVPALAMESNHGDDMAA
jgi:hypothetical protein